MHYSLEDCVQRGFNYAIVDEVDSILVDEAGHRSSYQAPLKNQQTNITR